MRRFTIYYPKVIENSIKENNPQLVKDYVALCIKVQDELSTFG